MTADRETRRGGDKENVSMRFLISHFTQFFVSFVPFVVNLLFFAP
jgi:hypothetical protein